MQCKEVVGKELKSTEMPWKNKTNKQNKQNHSDILLMILHSKCEKHTNSSYTTTKIREELKKDRKTQNIQVAEQIHYKEIFISTILPSLKGRQLRKEEGISRGRNG